MRQQRQRAEVTFRWGHRPPLVLVSVPSWSALCRQPLPPLRLSHAFIRGGLGASLGFACMRRVGFKPFWPLALVHQALPAIILAALRRFRGAALFHGSPPSPRLGAPFWPSGLTLRSSGLAFSQPLTLAVSQFSFQPPFTDAKSHTHHLCHSYSFRLRLACKVRMGQRRRLRPSAHE